MEMGSETYDVKRQGGESRGDASLGSRLHLVTLIKSKSITLAAYYRDYI